MKVIKGQIKLHVELAYIDQKVTTLNQDTSLLDNLINVNSNLSAKDAYTIFARYKFRNIVANRKIKDLSGG
ncbi:hypothetical protein IB678_09515 [Francisella adeliensis]|nr:hypothetical protein [Francisella adeliensis]MBK2097733.1 hypothetical protein [Francisella adeliensis]